MLPLTYHVWPSLLLYVDPMSIWYQFPFAWRISFNMSCISVSWWWVLSTFIFWKDFFQKTLDILLSTKYEVYIHSCSCPSNWKIDGEAKKKKGFLASGGEKFNLRPEKSLDHSELLCNKVLLKYKRDKLLTSEAGRKSALLAGVSKGVIYF